MTTYMKGKADMTRPPYCWKDFARYRATLESVGWQVRERNSLDKEVPEAVLVALHPRLPLKIAIYGLHDVQLLALSVTNHLA